MKRAQVVSSLQHLLCNWSGQERVNALLPPGPNVCIALPRFASAYKSTDPVYIEETLDIPVSRHNEVVSWEPLKLRSVIVHLAAETTTGHYRALVGKEGSWYLGDDSHSEPTDLHDPIVTSNCYVIFFERAELVHSAVKG